MLHVAVHELCRGFTGRGTGHVGGILGVVDRVQHEELTATVVLHELPNTRDRRGRSTLLRKRRCVVVDFRFAQRATKIGVPAHESHIEEGGEAPDKGASSAH